MIKRFYTNDWETYRKRRWVNWCMLLGFIPVAALSGLVLSPMMRTAAPFYWLTGAWMLAIVVFGNYELLFHCPRCHSPFFSWGLSSNSLARKCVHCGLPKWQYPDSTPL